MPRLRDNIRRAFLVIVQALAFSALTAILAIGADLPSNLQNQYQSDMIGERFLQNEPNSSQMPLGLNIRGSFRIALLELLPGELAEDIRCFWTTEAVTGAEITLASDIPTSSDHSLRRRIDEVRAQERWRHIPMQVIDVITRHGRKFVRVALLSRVVDSSNVVLAVSSVTIKIGPRTLSPGDLLSVASTTAPVVEHMAEHTANSSFHSTEPTPYLIVTSERLVDAVEDLRRYRMATGFNAMVETIEQIVAVWPGRDAAEQLRNRLIDYHSVGGYYVLLAGDDSVLPIRHAFHFRADSEPSLDLLQLCDLYFADVDGDWDADGDGIFGEVAEDHASLEPELAVGRLPFNDPAEFNNYAANLLQYESNPGGADRAWLERTMFFSSDEMRDTDSIGQHGQISRAFPSRFAVDTFLAVEQTTGYDTEPANAPAPEVTRQAQPAGIVNILAHGRTDGFVVRSSGYNTGARSYLLTLPEHSGHGCFDTLTDTLAPPFHYSLSCNNGGYDLRNDQLSVVEHLLGTRGGSVGMVAYSRWGWVSTSYLLQQAFFDSLFAHPGRPAIESMYDSKRSFLPYRDLMLGQNFYGDPALCVWTTVPDELTVQYDFETAPNQLTTLRNGLPESAIVTVVDTSGVVIVSGMSNPDGTFELPDGQSIHTLTATATLEGCTVARTELGADLVTDVPDEPQSLPGRYSLHQNYPNPFNPHTTITFELAAAGQVRLTIYNTLGQEVRTLHDSQLAAGSHSVNWDACDNSGSQSASGVYYYRLVTPAFVSSRKMILVR